MRRWYYYNGPDGLPGEVTVGNYSLIAGNFNCNLGSHLCAVYALYGGYEPIYISQRLADYFPIAKTSQFYYPDSSGDKPYVYTRN